MGASSGSRNAIIAAHPGKHGWRQGCCRFCIIDFGIIAVEEFERRRVLEFCRMRPRKVGPNGKFRHLLNFA